MRLILSIPHILLCLILCACITEFEPKGMEEIEGILVVEGVITDDESVITLSRSKGLSFEDNIFDMSPYHVTGAKVYIECDDGMQWGATSQNGGQYTIVTGKLDTERQYRLKIELEAHEYQSEFASPMVTPEIDSVFWTKRESGQPVNIHVATHAPDNMAHYYRWMYREDWVTEALVFKLGFPFFCAKNNNSTQIMIETTEKTAFGQLSETIVEISPTDDRFMNMYRMDVSQYAISKRAFDYYSNIKKNAQQTGDIFAHIPAELKGNISCKTNPTRPVIGYVDISSVTQKRLYIRRSEVYENPNLNGGLCAQFFFHSTSIPIGWVAVENGYMLRHCIDCEEAGGRPISELPDDWPIRYY